jgi:hypothetical protein
MTNKIEVLPSKNLAANGNVAWNIPYVNSYGAITAIVSGTWGSGTAKLEFSHDGTVWIDSGSSGITANGALKLTGVACTKVRVVLTGATAPDLDVTVAI